MSHSPISLSLFLSLSLSLSLSLFPFLCAHRCIIYLLAGNLRVDHNYNLNTLEGAFPVLTSTTGKIQIEYDYKLSPASLVAAFVNLEVSGTLATAAANQ